MGEKRLTTKAARNAAKTVDLHPVVEVGGVTMHLKPDVYADRKAWRHVRVVKWCASEEQADELAAELRMQAWRARCRR